MPRSARRSPSRASTARRPSRSSAPPRRVPRTARSPTSRRSGVRCSAAGPASGSRTGCRTGPTSPTRSRRPAALPARAAGAAPAPAIERPGTHAMYWADELASAADGPQVVNDSKTPSGTVHVGSLRGPVVLDVITRALRERGVPTTLLYGVDDLDPMDAQGLLTPDAVEREMGRPLSQVPDQVGDCHASYARHHAQIFIDIFAGLGIRPDRYYWMSDIYPTGQMDPFIRTALDRAEVVRDLYRRVSKVERPAGWLPVSVVCPVCGKVGTTLARDWDGATVAFECLPDYVTWARGCGTAGRIAPFGGAAKLPWNLEWAAQWSLFGVTIEPCGKDLATAGGSRDRSDALAREVFDRAPPGTRSSRSSRRSSSASSSSGRAPTRPSSSTRTVRTRSPACSMSSTGWRLQPSAARSRGSSPRTPTGS